MMVEQAKNEVMRCGGAVVESLHSLNTAKRHACGLHMQSCYPVNSSPLSLKGTRPCAGLCNIGS
jgi:hypothetical protein